MQTPKRKIFVLGVERELPAQIAEQMVREGRAQFAELETATAEAPEKAVRAPRKRKASTKPKAKPTAEPEATE
jgi:hypothetical protein